MSRSFQFVVFGVAALGVLAIEGRGGGDSRSSPRFVATFTSATDAGAKPAELSVVFFGTEPDAGEAGTVLGKCLDAASALDGGADIVARAWFSPSSESTERQAIAFEESATALVYRAKDKSISVMEEKAGDVGDATESRNAGASDADAIISDAGVADACEAVAPERLAKLAEVAIENRGERRSQIVRGLRTWCKGNGVNLDRAMSLCVVALSKAAHQEPEKSVADVTEATKRGGEHFKTANCARCHRDNGRGGPRGSNLTDDVWDHCDGSVAGISKVIVSGVPQSQLKDPNRPFPMNPVTRFSKSELADLAVYVRSLSK